MRFGVRNSSTLKLSHVKHLPILAFIADLLVLEVRHFTGKKHRPPCDPMPAGPRTAGRPRTRHLARKFGPPDGQTPGATYTTPLPLLCVLWFDTAERPPWA